MKARSKTMISRRALPHIFATAAIVLAAPAPLFAQAYPSRAIHFIMPFPPGPADVTLRLYAQKVSQDWKQPTVVETRIGATGTVGTEMAVKAAPDGYTLLFTVDLPITMAPNLLKVPYDAQRDLIPIAAVVESTNVLVVNRAVQDQLARRTGRGRQSQTRGTDFCFGRHRIAGPPMRGDDQAAGRH